MSRYNHHFATHFGSCRLLAQTRDMCRNRDVRVYLLPGEWEHVGVSDGTDCWIAPVAADPFSVNVKRLLDTILAGGSPAVHVDPKFTATPTSTRARKPLPRFETTVTGRTRLVPEAQVLSQALEQQQTIIRRRNVIRA